MWDHRAVGEAAWLFLLGAMSGKNELFLCAKKNKCDIVKMKDLCKHTAPLTQSFIHSKLITPCHSNLTFPPVLKCALGKITLTNASSPLGVYYVDLTRA